MSEQAQKKTTGDIVSKINTLEEANEIRKLLMSSGLRLWLFVYKQDDSYVVEVNNDQCGALNVVELAKVKYLIDENETAQLREMMKETSAYMPGKPPEAYDDVYDFTDEDFEDIIE